MFSKILVYSLYKLNEANPSVPTWVASHEATKFKSLSEARGQLVDIILGSYLVEEYRWVIEYSPGVKYLVDIQGKLS